MSGRTRNPQSVLNALREAQIVNSKPRLTAEITVLILDHLNPNELIRCARTCKRIRDMVYDDGRWIQRLRLIKCWDDSSARENTEASLPSLDYPTGERYSRTDSAEGALQEREIPLITLNSPTTSTSPQTDQKKSQTTLGNTPQGRISNVPEIQSSLDLALNILDTVQSRRGLARHEYGRIHKVLIPFYNDAIHVETPSTAKIFRAYRDPEHQARMLDQLKRFSNADISLGWSHRVAKINAVDQAFEDAIFTEFEDGLSRNDVTGKMKKYAHVLFYLNGGRRAVNAFLASNEVLSSPYRLGGVNDWISIDQNPVFLADEYLVFLRKLASTLYDQCQVINAVFPIAINVAESFLNTFTTVVFANGLNKLFQQLLESNHEQFVKAVSSTCLQNIGFLKTVQTVPLLDQSNTLARGLQDIYTEWMDHYYEQEISWFKRRSNAEVIGWERQLSQQDASLEAMYMDSVNRQADKRDFLTSFKKAVMAPVNIFPTIYFGTRAITTSRPHGNLNRSSRSPSAHSRRPPSQSAISSQQDEVDVRQHVSRSPSPGDILPTTELQAKAAIMQSRLEGIKTLFSLEVALSLVHMAKASIERVAIFAQDPAIYDDRARRKAEAIFVILLQTLGERHVRIGFDQAVEHLSAYDPRAVEQRGETQVVAPLVTFLELVHVGDLIQQMIDVFYEQELIAARLVDKNDVLSNTAKEKKRFEQMLDEKVAAGLNKGIEVLIAEVEYICATTQNAEDFNPEVTGSKVNQIMDVSTTNTARWIIELVGTHTRMLVGSTDKSILDVFNQEVGLRLFNVLCKHVKRQRVSITGAPRLMSDMNHYFTFIQTFKNRDLLQYFTALREMSQIYLIDSSSAKELAAVIADHDRYSGIFGAEEILEFAERRADWYQIRTKVEKVMYGIGCALM